MINSLKDLLCEFFSARILERNAKNLESVGKTLHANTDWSVFHIGNFCLFNWIVISIDDSIKIMSNSFGNMVELLEVKILSHCLISIWEFSVILCESRKRN